MMLLNENSARRWRIWEWEQSLNIPTPLWRAPHLYHISASENLSFNPATPLTTVHPHWTHLPQWHKSHSSEYCYLMFSNDKSPSTDSSPLHGRAELSSHVQQHMVYHHTDDAFQGATKEEDFPTAPWNEDIWLEEPVPVRHLCIIEQSQQDFLCSYPCPCSLNLPPLTPEDTPVSYHEMMDLDDISDFQDVMTTTSKADIPSLDDVLDFAYGQ